MWHLQMCGLVLDTITKLLKMAENRQRIDFERTLREVVKK